jgi:hypothetical protein
MKDESICLLADSHSKLKCLKYYFHTLYVHGVNDVKKTEKQTAEILLHETNCFEVKIAIGKHKR